MKVKYPRWLGLLACIVASIGASVTATAQQTTGAAMISRRYMTGMDRLFFWLLTFMTIFGGLIYWAWWSTQYTLQRNGPDRAAVLAREAAIDHGRAEYAKGVGARAKSMLSFLIPAAGFMAVYVLFRAVLQ